MVELMRYDFFNSVRFQVSFDYNILLDQLVLKVHLLYAHAYVRA
jgi:hypothetical protein